MRCPAGVRAGVRACVGSGCSESCSDSGGWWSYPQPGGNPRELSKIIGDGLWCPILVPCHFDQLHGPRQPPVDRAAARPPTFVHDTAAGSTTAGPGAEKPRRRHCACARRHSSVLGPVLGPVLGLNGRGRAGSCGMGRRGSGVRVGRGTKPKRKSSLRPRRGPRLLMGCSGSPTVRLLPGPRGGGGPGSPSGSGCRCGFSPGAVWNAGAWPRSPWCWSSRRSSPYSTSGRGVRSRCGLRRSFGPLFRTRRGRGRPEGGGRDHRCRRGACGRGPHGTRGGRQRQGA